MYKINLKNSLLFLKFFIPFFIYSQEFIIDSSQVSGQLLNSTCELSNIDFGSKNVFLYKGSCRNGKANGWGEIIYNGGYKKAFFKENKIEDFMMEYYSIKDDIYIFGPNKGYNFHGVCSVASKNRVWISNYSDGQEIGSSNESFLTNKPTIYYDETIKINGQYGDLAKNGERIPGTNKILVCDKHDGGSDRRFLLNLENGKVIWQFGKENSTIKIRDFIGFDENNKSAFYSTSSSNGAVVKGVFAKINYETGTIQIISKLPINIKIKDNLQSNSNCIGSLYFEDGSNILIENLDNLEKGIVITKFSNDKALVFQKTVPFIRAHSFALDESKDRIALLYSQGDSSCLSYFDLTTLNFSGVIYKKLKSKTDFGVAYNFSPKKGYLVQKSDRGTFIYQNEELLMIIPGTTYGFNNSETTLITNYQSDILAYNLEKKSLIWRMETSIVFKNASGNYESVGGSDYYNSGYYLVDNDFVLITGISPNVRIFRIKVPQEEDLISNYINQDYIRTIVKLQSLNESETQELVNTTQKKELEVQSKLNSNNNSQSKFDPNKIIWKKVNNGKEVHYCYWCNKRVYPRKKSDYETQIPQINEFTTVFLSFHFLLNHLKFDKSDPYLFIITLYEFDDFCSRKCKAEYEYYKSH
jgi:hypothetical protein